MIPLNMRELFKYFALVSFSNLEDQYFKLFAGFNKTRSEEQ